MGAVGERLVRPSLRRLKVRLHPFRLGADRGNRGEKLRRGAPEYGRPIPHFIALVDIDASTIYEAEITEAIHLVHLETRAINP